MKGEAKYHGTNGTLYLTEKRLAFVYEKRSFTSRNKYTSVDLPLSVISEVTEQGRGLFKKILVFTYREKLPIGLPRYEFKVKNLKSWINKIQEECSKETSEITVSSLKCNVCGTELDLNYEECPICGVQLI